ncbi:MAG: 2OG-Fe(II) oxygenase [Bacteroidetes bacterium]|nr:2OG-Fe(II) oxygenase [Bacteroidota bacterium]
MNGQVSLEKWSLWINELSDKNYVVIDNFLNTDCYKQVTTFLTAHIQNFKQAGIGALDQNLINKDIRGDATFWLDSKRDMELNLFWQKVEETIDVLNRECFLSLNGFEFHLTKYPPGAHYKRHLDQFQNRNNRLISVVIYLNEHWQPGNGGELEIYDNEQIINISPIANRCVLFRSDLVEHAVLTSNTNRFSLTGWLLHKPAALGKFFT